MDCTPRIQGKIQQQSRLRLLHPYQRLGPKVRLFSMSVILPLIDATVSTTTMGSSLGTGGMETKIIAAEIATGAGVTTIITSSKSPENIFAIIEYHNVLTIPATPSEPTSAELPTRPRHTVFLPSLTPMRDLKAWTSHTLFPAGAVVIDAGAHRVLSRRESGGRLLAAGVVGVMGAFASGQAVRVVILAKSEVLKTPSSTQSSRPASPTHRQLATSIATSRSRSGSFGDQRALDTPTPPSEQFSDEDVIEVGRGLAMYNYAQISRVRGLNRFVASDFTGFFLC